MSTIHTGTIVLVGGNLGVVEREATQARADGYLVTELGAGGTLPHFAPDYIVKPAVLGGNVCDQPRGTHWCGLVHAPTSVLTQLKTGAA